jgi:hypothetical protein
METTLGRSVVAAAIMDRDYRCDEERDAIASQCREFCSQVTIHNCKEIENLVLVPSAIDRAAERRLADRGRRTGESTAYKPHSAQVLLHFAEERKNYVMAQYVAERRRFERASGPTLTPVSRA